MTYALIADRYAWHGLSLHQKQARFYGIPLLGRSRWLEQAKDILANQGALSNIRPFRTETWRFSEKICCFKIPISLWLHQRIGAFCPFFDKRTANIKTGLFPSLTACIVTSELCTEEDSRLLATAFGVPIINEYGASELDIIAFTDRAGDWILSEENLYVEILDEANRPLPDGQEGRIIITALHNTAFPMVRYDIGDIGSH
jgi:phenylacetate-CoA ligase